MNSRAAREGHTVSVNCKNDTTCRLILSALLSSISSLFYALRPLAGSLMQAKRMADYSRPWSLPKTRWIGDENQNLCRWGSHLISQSEEPAHTPLFPPCFSARASREHVQLLSFSLPPRISGLIRKETQFGFVIVASFVSLAGPPASGTV
jgi:hypothetical protein